ncbi:c-type cytochrome [Nocardioides daejeonensis]|uniref:cytochrome bc1 complex diheme cytochrome c subunit n=1 Tax=Nocardioides daejeonensis TaxID=1046556 RepID=UPI001EF6E59A|nr:cytochrome c [Nocardioides daejeonensis]
MRFLNRSAGRLSRHRRSRVAGLLVMLLGLLFMGGLYQVVLSPSNADTQTKSDEELIKEGRELFLVGCAFCHGQNGEGIKSADGQYGPSLVGVGGAAVNFQVSTGRMPMQNPGQQAPAKEPVYSEDEIDALSAYVASLGPGPEVPTAAEYDIDKYGLSADERRDAVVRGGQLFLTNCTACHNFDGSGGAMPWGKYAPSLRSTSEKNLYQAMLTGPQQMPVFSDEVMLPQDKASIIAYLESIKEEPSHGGFGLGGLGPVSEGMFAWLFGIGGLVGFAYWIAAHTTRSTKTKSSEGTQA